MGPDRHDLCARFNAGRCGTILESATAGGIVVYENGADISNSVLKAFLGYQIIRFEDVLTTPEWNPESNIRVQRLIAQKVVN